MNILTAIGLVRRSPYALRRLHEWRGYRVNRDGLWPLITIGWWTWDVLPEIAGQRVAEVADTLRTAPAADQPSLL